MARYINDSRFFCINCGQEGIPIFRRQSLQREKFHRKVLWCTNCRKRWNFIECKTPDEVSEFKENFKNGAYVDEAKECEKYLEEHILADWTFGKR